MSIPFGTMNISERRTWINIIREVKFSFALYAVDVTALVPLFYQWHNTVRFFFFLSR
jgi:hypothetical protein